MNNGNLYAALTQELDEAGNPAVIVYFDENGRPDRWKIENSWGKDVGREGYFVCSEKYFRDFVYVLFFS